MGRIPKRLIWTVKLAPGFALLAVLVVRSDTGTLLGRLGSVDLRWLAAMFVIWPGTPSEVGWAESGLWLG